MEHQLNDHGQVTILRLKGDLTFQEIEDLGNILHQAVQSTNGEIVVDLSNVGYADSSVTGQFVAAKREAEVKRRRLVLSNLSPTVKKVLQTGHADYQVSLYDSTEEAIADLAEKARGGEARKVVRNIRCGHEDCVFYTYAKTDFNVVAACEYPYPEEITNGPNCRCYRVNWRDLRNHMTDEESPFRKRTKKESPYYIRDTFQEEPPAPTTPVSGGADFDAEPGFTEEVTLSQSPAVDFDSHVLPAAPRPASAPSTDWDFSTGIGTGPKVNLDDPFADTNFPSAVRDTVTEIPTPRPAPAPRKPRPSVKIDPAPEAVPVLKEERREAAFEPDVENRPVLEAVEPRPKAASTAAERIEPEPLSPMEVVREFVEAWNEGRFTVEYDLLSSQSKVFDRNDYCSRRRALRNAQFESYGRATRQGIAKEDAHSIQQNIASVEITRLDRTPKGVRCYAQHYKLIHEDGHWKVQTVRDGEARKNPTNPPPDRKMNATEFFGKSKTIKGKPPTF